MESYLYCEITEEPSPVKLCFFRAMNLGLKPVENPAELVLYFFQKYRYINRNPVPGRAGKPGTTETSKHYTIN
jgi:hypothetical protein